MSLRARLLAGMGVVAVVLVVTAVVVTRTTEAHLIDQVDADLADADRPPGSHDRQSPPGPESSEAFSSIYLGVVRDDETIETIWMPNLTADSPPVPDIAADEALAAADDGQPFTVGSVDSDTRYRVRAHVDDRSGEVVVAALPLTDVDDAVARLVTVEMIATLIILAVLAVVTWWVIRLGVRPIKQMTSTATAIAAGDLSRRVVDGTPGTEASELGSALNQMLANLEESLDQRTRSENRLRQFVADASHELRTPVTTVRGYAELYRAGGLTAPDELDEAMRRTEQEAIRMGSLVDDMLNLARLDQGRPLLREPVDLDSLVRDSVQDARAVHPGRLIELSSAGPTTVIGDEERLRQVVGNIVGNATVHTPPATPIAVRLARQDGRAVLEVSDRGPGMTSEQAERAFERFYRVDPSRSRHRGGSGLGLAIVDATVTAHGGATSITTAPGQGTTVRVELPWQE